MIGDSLGDKTSYVDDKTLCHFGLFFRAARVAPFGFFSNRLLTDLRPIEFRVTPFDIFLIED